MDTPDRKYEDAFREISSFAEELYGEAGRTRDGTEAETASADIAPMYEALLQITERYEQPRLIGRGATKEVYRIHDRHLARDVAMAKPLAEHDETRFDAFLREAHITARLEHPAIIKLFNMGVDADQRPFFTMELKTGSSLRNLLHKLSRGEGIDAYPLARRLEILMRICEAVAYAHSRRVLHLDLKPENIQVGAYGEVQVCDWGLGVVIPGRDSHAPDNEVFLDPDLYGPLLLHAQGTPGYMAPEQQRPRAPRTPQMDIYALGCLLKEMVMLLPPEACGDPTTGPDLALASIMTKACRTDAKDRYASATDMQQDLARYLGGYSTSVEGAGLFREAMLFYRRNRMACLVTLLLSAVIAVGTLFFIGQLQRSRAVAEQARGRAEQALQDALAEKEKREALLEGQSTRLAEISAITTKGLFVRPGLLPQTIREADQSLAVLMAMNPSPDSPIWAQAFWIRFVMQDFASALDIIRDGKSTARIKNLVPLAEKYAGRPGEGDRLSTADFLLLLTDLYATKRPFNRHPLMDIMLTYDAAKGRPMAERRLLAQGLLRMLNPQSPDADLQVRDGGNALEITGRNVSRLRIDGAMHCVLMDLNPRSLSVAGTALVSLQELNGLQLLELDLRDTPVRDPGPLHSMPSLRRLRISPGQFSPAQLVRLPDFVETVEAP